MGLACFVGDQYAFPTNPVDSMTLKIQPMNTRNGLTPYHFLERSIY